MKLKIYLTVIVLAATITASAQITITTPPSSRYIGVDTVAKVTDFTKFNSVTKSGADVTWDLSNVTYDQVYRYTYERENASSYSFSNATYAKGIFYPFAGSLKYEVFQSTTVGNDSRESLGEDVDVTQILSIAALTGNSNDELVFPKQKIAYSSAEVHTKYPLTYGSSWTTENYRTTQFNLTVTAYGLNNTPGARKTYRTVTDSVVGWGTIKVKDWRSDEIHDVEVLQMYEHRVSKDSFFLGGSEAPPQLLAAFGLTQGQESHAYFVYFVRPNEILPLAEIECTNADFTGNESMFVHQDRIDAGSSNVSPVSAPSFTTYPNPITDNTFSVYTPNQNLSDVEYVIHDLLGKEIQRGNLKNNKVQIADDVSNGTYTLSLFSNETMLGTKKLLIRK